MPLFRFITIFLFFPDLANTSFPNDDIRQTEDIFDGKFGREIQLKQTPLERTNDKTSRLTWSKNPQEYWFIADILYQLQNQNPEQPARAIEDSMVLNNIEKQKKIDPIFKTFIQFTRQLEEVN